MTFDVFFYLSMIHILCYYDSVHVVNFDQYMYAVHSFKKMLVSYFTLQLKK